MAIISSSYNLLDIPGTNHVLIHFTAQQKVSMTSLHTSHLLMFDNDTTLAIARAIISVWTVLLPDSCHVDHLECLYTVLMFYVYIRLSYRPFDTIMLFIAALYSCVARFPPSIVIRKLIA